MEEPKREAEPERYPEGACCPWPRRGPEGGADEKAPPPPDREEAAEQSEE